jgi:hypothetical protein
MKTKFFKSVLPMLAFAFAIFGAFAFNTPAESRGATEFIGHIKVNDEECTETDELCQDVDNNVPCTQGTEQLYKMVGGTSCPDELWRIL